MKKLFDVDKMKEKYIYIGFIVIMLTTAGAILIYGNHMRNEQLQERIYAYERQHEKTFSSLYLLTEKMNSIYNQQLLNRELIEWLQQPKELTEDMYRLSLVQKSFLNLIQSHSGIKSIYLHNNKNDRVLSTPYMISDLAGFPHKEVFEAYYNSDKPLMWVPTTDETAERLSGQRVISFVSGIPNRLRTKNGVLAFNVDEQYIREDIFQRSESFLWLDAEDHVLLSGNPDYLKFFSEHKEDVFNQQKTSFLYKDHLVIHSESSDNGWKLITILPKHILQHKESSQFSYLAIVLVLVAASGTLPLLFSRYLHRVRESWYKGNVEANLPDLQTGFVTDLLSGKFLPDLIQKSKEYQIDLSSDFFQVVVFQIDDYYNYSLSKSDHERLLMNKIIFNAIKWTFSVRFNAYVVNSEFGKIAVLLGYDANKLGAKLKQELEDTIRYIQQDVREQYDLTVCAGISEQVAQADQIYECYAEALLSLAFKSIYGKESIIYYEQLPSGRASLQTVHLTEPFNRISGYLTQGELDKIEATLDEMIQELIGSEPYTLDWLHALFSNMLSNVMRFAIDQRIDLHEHFKEDMFFTLYNYEFIDEKKAYLLKICDYIISQLTSEPAEKNTTAEWIISYIDKHYDQPISLGILADKLSMSQSYLSSLIKNYLGIGFVDYVIRLRIEKAVRLLENESLTVYQVAEECGYDTTHTFIRQFKKMYNITPNEYRKKYIRQHEKM